MYKTKYLYVYSNDPDDWRNEPLYIGQQARYGNDFVRHYEHLNNADPQCEQFREIKYLYVALLLNSLGINDLEHYLIEKYNPPMNSVFSIRKSSTVSHQRPEINFMEDTLNSLVWVKFECSSFNKTKIYDAVQEAMCEYYNQKESINTVDTVGDYLNFIVTVPDKLKSCDVYIRNGNFFMSCDDDTFYSYRNISKSNIVLDTPLFEKSSIYTLKRNDIEYDIESFDDLNKKFREAKYIRTCDKSFIYPKSFVLSNVHEFASKEENRLKEKAESILSSLFPFSKRRTNKNSGIDTILHVLNKTNVDGINVLRSICSENDCVSDGNLISKTNGVDLNFIYPHPRKPYTTVTDIFSFDKNKWVYVKSYEAYNPKEEDVYLRVSGDGSWIKTHFSYHDDDSYSSIITPEGVKTLLDLYKNKVIPLCREVLEREPDFSKHARLIDFVEDFETGEVITDDEPEALAKIGNGYNVRNHNLIFYELGGLLRAYSFSRKLGLLYASFDNIPGKRCTINRKIYTNVVLGLYDFLDFVDSTETKKIIDDMKNLTISQLVEAYSSI